MNKPRWRPGPSCATTHPYVKQVQLGHQLSFPTRCRAQPALLSSLPPSPEGKQVVRRWARRLRRKRAGVLHQLQGRPTLTDMAFAQVAVQPSPGAWRLFNEAVRYIIMRRRFRDGGIALFYGGKATDFHPTMPLRAPASTANTAPPWHACTSAPLLAPDVSPRTPASPSALMLLSSYFGGSPRTGSSRLSGRRTRLTAARRRRRPLMGQIVRYQQQRPYRTRGAQAGSQPGTLQLSSWERRVDHAAARTPHESLVSPPHPSRSHQQQRRKSMVTLG